MAPQPAGAADFDFSACGPTDLSGTASYSPGITATAQSQTVGLVVSMTCTGPGDEAGPWTLSFNGIGDESCGVGADHGTGGGSVTGANGNTGETWTLDFSYERYDIFLYISAGPDGPEGQVADLTLIATGLAAPCPRQTGSFFGLAALADTAPGPAPTALGVVGTGTSAPGYDPNPLGYPVGWTMDGTAAGVVNGNSAQCTFRAEGWGSAYGFVEEWGVGKLRCNGPGGLAVTCQPMNYRRIGTVFNGTGPCSGSAVGTLDARFALGWLNFNRTTSFTVQGSFTIT